MNMRRCVVLSLYVGAMVFAMGPLASAEGAATSDLSGKVTMGGKPLAECRISVWPRSGGSRDFNANTGVDGAYTVKGVPVGQVQVSVSPIGVGSTNRSMFKSVDVENGKPAVADFDFSEVAETGTVEGVITIDGEPPTNAGMGFRSLKSSRYESWSTSIKDGKFRLEKVPVGPASLNVSCDDKNNNWRNKSVPITVLKDQVVRQEFAFDSPGKLTGKVKSMPAGATVVATVVKGDFKLEKLDDATLKQIYKQTVARTGVKPDGAFTFEQVDNGPNTVIAWVVTPGAEPPTRFVVQKAEVKAGKEVTVELALP